MHKTNISAGLGHQQYLSDSTGLIRGFMLAAPKPSKVQDLSQTNNQIVEINELLILVSHGSRPTNRNRDPVFGNMTPEVFAQKIHILGILPQNYQGQIYLDGCHTGEPIGNLYDGTSFAERFKLKLETFNVYGNFSVKGNLGAATTGYNPDLYPMGTEWIEADERSRELMYENAGNMINASNSFSQHGHRYYIDAQTYRFKIGPFKFGHNNIRYYRSKIAKITY